MTAGIRFGDYDFTELSLVDRPQHAAVLGRIFTSWSLIEAAVTGLLGLLMHADHRAALAILGTFKTNSSRVNAVRRVGKEMLEPELRPGFDALMKDVLAYAEERNAIAHNLWGTKADEPDLVYRMPMSVISNFVVETPHKSTYDADGLVASFRGQVKAFTIQDLEQLEQQGRDILTRVMGETTAKAYARAIEKHNPAVL